MELKSISRYRILEKLGAGGMGEVFLAEDTKRGRKVALKILAEELTQNRDRLSRFDQEAYAASALNHPNILTIYEMGDESGRHYIATEFVDGMTLRKRMAGSPMELAEILNVAIQVTGALEEAHAAGIIHRDIKPENVMIRKNGHVKVLDFGLAKLTEKVSNGEDTDTEAVTRALVQTDAGVVLGTSQYMSPEQARGKPVDARTDIWSVGVVLYETVAGRPPFVGETSSDVMAAILKTDPAPLKQVAPQTPDELQRIVLKCLRHDREARYQTAKELLVDLKSLKQEMEFAAKLERSSSSLLGNSSPEIAVPVSAVASEIQSAALRSTSSAEYIVNQINTHRRGVLAMLAVLIVIGAGLGY